MENKVYKLKYAGDDYLLFSKKQNDIMIPLPKEMAKQLPKGKNEFNAFDESIS